MRKIKVIHVINKRNLGGIEELVSCLLTNSEKDSPFHHEYFVIAKSKIALFLFKKKVIRRLVYFSATFRIIRRVGRVKLDPSMETILLFHHAECHRLYMKIPRILRSQLRGHIYVHQGYSNYPKNLAESTLKAIIESKSVIFYSSKVEESWREIDPRLTHISTSVIHNFVCESRKISRLKHSNSSPNLHFLYLGRNVSWKRPYRAIEWAMQIANPNLRVEISFAGISATESDVNLPSIPLPINDEVLKVNFLGKVSDVTYLFMNVDGLFVPADELVARETIGIGALEALSSGIPVFISNRNATDYNQRGIFGFNELLDYSLDKSAEEIRSNFILNEFEVRTWSYYNSKSRYEKDLLSFVNKQTGFQGHARMVV